VPIIGERPQRGVRVVLTRPGGDDAPWVYEGAAHTPHASFALRATVTESGDVDVHAAPGTPPELAPQVRLIVRTAYKQAKADGQPPPLRIARWRGEK
jgi:hypothetical protein